ncbi:MAG: PAS domain-containing protein, partial [candidate division NC10 bacterium]|nr:PAS domain-containing protein [candidate division NC10 bacterium]
MLYMLEDLNESHAVIERAKKEWEKTFDSITDFISINDTDYNVRRVNRAMADRLGKKPGELIGKKCYEVYHGTACPWPE